MKIIGEGYNGNNIHKRQRMFGLKAEDFSPIAPGVKVKDFTHEQKAELWRQVLLIARHVLIAESGDPSFEPSSETVRSETIRRLTILQEKKFPSK